MSVKKDRIESLIKRELAPIIQNRLNDPSLEFVSITDVELTNDLSYATIYVSFLKEENKEKGLAALDKAKGLLRSEIAKVLTTRRTPELIFKYDDSIQHGAKIDQLLDQISKKD
ncbi:30S ribosome-binding factor RbfA [Erysipelothrix urinaevulpis]|uniref:30S ribosome-binding factor RbfA n=1 Tax=Erysipelothrix urinaevulpis TaxID=2683717 RepID=UPI00135C21BD|nr:30S ribosome-binding factor RbfA [Erysipelothrix urinaevulpis]